MQLMPKTRLGVAWRAVLALLVVVACAAATTATAGLLEFKSIGDAFNQSKALGGVGQDITLPAPGQPETLFLIGADLRNGQSGVGNTDTMMLVRIDDSSSTINVLSIPRDLGVDIPGIGDNVKINSAFAADGAKLLIKTLRADVFPNLHVSHILVVDFAGFAKLVNEIGCVYTDVDHRYYNYNDGTAGTDFSSVDLQPGYQKLCGGSGGDLGGANTALAFVRFRHNDSDIVRESRQQDFLRWAKQDYTTADLWNDKTQLLNTFARNVHTDPQLHSGTAINELFNLAINADSTTIKSIPFPVLGSDGGNLTFSETASENAYRRLMTPTTAPPAGTTTSTTVTPPPPTTTTTPGKHAKKRKPAPPTVPVGMREDTGDGRSQAGQLGNVGFPIYYPKYIPESPASYEYCFAFTGDCSEGYAGSVYAKSYPRRYKIEGDDGKRYPAYVMTLVLGTPGYHGDLGTGQYFTVQGTTWGANAQSTAQEPPILRTPTETRYVDGKWLYVYKQGGAFADVAWRTKTGVYWISNTIQNDLSPRVMVQMAASFTRAGG